MPLLFAYVINRFSHDVAQTTKMLISDQSVRIGRLIPVLLLAYDINRFSHDVAHSILFLSYAAEKFRRMPPYSLISYTVRTVSS